jgi:hypothetical protein
MEEVDFCEWLCRCPAVLENGSPWIFESESAAALKESIYWLECVDNEFNHFADEGDLWGRNTVSFDPPADQNTPSGSCLAVELTGSV